LVGAPVADVETVDDGRIVQLPAGNLEMVETRLSPAAPW